MAQDVTMASRSRDEFPRVSCALGIRNLAGYVIAVHPCTACQVEKACALMLTAADDGDDDLWTCCTPQYKRLRPSSMYLECALSYTAETVQSDSASPAAPRRMFVALQSMARSLAGPVYVVRAE